MPSDDRQARDRRVADEYRAGWSARAIGIRMGISHQTVINALRRENVELRPAGRSPKYVEAVARAVRAAEIENQAMTFTIEQVAEMVDMRYRGESIRAIADAFDATPKDIRAALASAPDRLVRIP